MRRQTHPWRIVWMVIVLTVISSNRLTRAQGPPWMPFDPDHQPPVTFHKNDLTVQVIASGTSRSLSVSRHGDPPQIVLLPFQFYQVNEIWEGPPGKLIVVGMSGGYIWEIGILSLEPLLLADRFTCFSPSVSPNGHYVAFVKFFPPHFVEGPEDHEMLYTVVGSARQNRPPTSMLSETIDVGLPVYPPGIANVAFDNINRPSGTEHRFASVGFFWAPDSSQYVFADLTANTFSLVRVVVNTNLHVSRLQINYEKMCFPIKKALCQVRLGRVLYDTSHNRLSAEFDGYGGDQSLQQTFTFKLQQFEPVTSIRIAPLP